MEPWRRELTDEAEKSEQLHVEDNLFLVGEWIALRIMDLGSPFIPKILVHPKSIQHFGGYDILQQVQRGVSQTKCISNATYDP